MDVHARSLRVEDGSPSSTEQVAGLPAERLLQDWGAAHRRALDYLNALGLAPAERCAIALAAVERALWRSDWEPGGEAIGEALRAARELVHERVPSKAAGPWQGFAPATPPILRGAMVPEPLERRFARRAAAPRRAARSESRPDDRPRADLRRARRGLDWVRASKHRRLMLGILVLLPSVIASGFMVNVLPGKGDTVIEALIVVLFGALFGWISIGFWTALCGFLVLARGRDRFEITRFAGEADPREAARAIAPEARTAIVMPICAEPVERVFAGLRAIHRSLEQLDALERFDFFVLSDTADPSVAAREEEAWASWCRDTGGFGRIFYRRRKVRLERKSGNVADFCRRFGRRYRYMIMLDADSVMTGESLVRLVRMMEARPEVGLIQTAPAAFGRRSLLARVQQFSGSVYGPMFTAGLHFWQLGDSQYWGHNAILRIAPFMSYCGLPRLPGKPPFGGEILSHDFVEAALLGRAGWTIWLAYDLPGSYEEVPSNLLEEMGRDRRWCQGNLQHLKLLFSKGLYGAHRALFVNGVLSYVSALLWFAFLLLSTAEAIRHALVEPDYFPNGPSLFPEWPIWHPDWAIWLLAVTGVILFLPKLLAIGLVWRARREARSFGGLSRLVLSALLEVLLSSLLAPIRMVFHSRFVLTNLIGRTVVWGAQGREDAETSWGEAIRRHGLDTLFASAWGALLFWLNPDYFWWVLPIIGALFLSVPLSVLTSRISAGERTRRARLFLTPEESSPPEVLRDLEQIEAAEGVARQGLRPAQRADGFVRAVVDPAAYELHRGLLGRPRSLRDSIRAARRALIDRALAEGAAALSARERRILFHDPESIAELHRRVWALADPGRAARWSVGGG